MKSLDHDTPMTDGPDDFSAFEDFLNTTIDDLAEEAGVSGVSCHTVHPHITEYIEAEEDGEGVIFDKVMTRLHRQVAECLTSEIVLEFMARFPAVITDNPDDIGGIAWQVNAQDLRLMIVSSILNGLAAFEYTRTAMNVEHGNTFETAALGLVEYLEATGEQHPEFVRGQIAVIKAGRE